jgi:uncharacterized protein YjbI with pentapeptide repeats
MLKRWAAWPRGIRWLAGGIAAFVLALAVAWVLFVPVADWLAHHDVGPVKGPLHETALDNARGRLLTLGAGLFAAGALVFTARNFTLSREGQVTDRYTKAITQLGSKKLDVRIGGIYALERIARDSAKDHPTVMEVLTAFIREHSRKPLPEPTSATGPLEPAAPEPAAPEPGTRPDIQAAVTVIGRRNAKHDRQRTNLHGVHLRDADLPEANLDGADLGGANLRFAKLRVAKLTHADLGGAKLDGAYLVDADLRFAKLRMAKLTHTDLIRADLAGADLIGADLTDADLTRADLTDADLGGADLTRADLTRANLTRANLTRGDLARGRPASTKLTRLFLPSAKLTDVDFTDADLRGVKWPAGTPVPEGWKRDTGSGQLKRASSGIEAPEAN